MWCDKKPCDKAYKKGVFSLEYDKETLRDMICELQEELFAEKQRFNDYS